MKRKIYIQPHSLIFSAVLIALAFASKRYDRNVFLFEMILACLSAVFFIVMSLNYKNYVNRIVRSAVNGIGGMDHAYLEKFSVPIVITGKDGDILWYNSRFNRRLAAGKDVTGDSVLPFVNNADIKAWAEGPGGGVEYNGRYYSVIASSVEDSIVFYFIDDTEYKLAANQYHESRPVVITISLDNRDDFERNSSDDDVNIALIRVETVLKRWVSSCSGVYTKSSAGRYKAVIDEKHLKEAIDDKFKLLDSVRRIKVSEGSSLVTTISMGIGRNAKSLGESEEWSLQALDLAFGRGGDQVVIKTEDNYEFFGGVAKGIERHEKVKARVIAKSLVEKLKEADNIYIMGHQSSDLDAVGAAIGMWSVISKTYPEHDTKVVVDQKTTLAGQFLKRLTEHGYKGVFIEPSEARKHVDNNTMVIIVDTHSPTFVEDPELYKMCKKVVVIDHHRMMVNHIDNACVFFHEPFASSASEMVTQLVQYMNESSLNSYEAEALLAGIMLDTKNFVLRTGVNTFEAAAFLKRKGADTVEVKRLFADSIVSYRMRSRLVAEAKTYRSSAIAIADDEINRQSNVRITAAQAADELLSIKDIQASYVIYRSLGCTCVSARSLGDLNVQLIMEHIGGGGHQTMAGANLGDISTEEARQKLIKAIDEMTAQALDSTTTIKRRNI
ncbi:MAG: DHH family phosphoesterase [Clostridia bacterium]|nr:DHH family phosphoesterase [Clostridia bacterium]